MEKDRFSLEVGSFYPCMDTLGMMVYKRKYLGKGFKYFPIREGSYHKISDEYYVFGERETPSNGSYKFAIAKPIFYDLKFTGNFQVDRYGNDLTHIFVEFKQPYFSMEDTITLKVDKFPKDYSEDICNSGPNGYFI